MKYASQDFAVRLWTRSNDVVSGVPSVSSIYTNTTSFIANKAVVVVVALLSIVWSRI